MGADLSGKAVELASLPGAALGSRLGAAPGYAPVY